MAPDGDEATVGRLAKASLLKWEPLNHTGVIKQLRHGERYFLTTRGMCDCGTEIGARIRTDATLPPQDPDYSRTIKNFKKKGWSDAKIDRWLAQSKADATRKHAEAAARLSGPHPEIERWIQFVTAVLTEHHASWIGIMVHWYGGNLTTEAIAAGIAVGCRSRSSLSRISSTQRRICFTPSR